MKKALIATAVALAFPAAALASAHGAFANRKLGSGTFTSSVTTTGRATSRTGDRGTFSCAPATDVLSLVGSSTVSLTLTGKSCAWTTTGSTTSTSMFFGQGTDAKAFLVARATTPSTAPSSDASTATDSSEGPGDGAFL